MQKSFQEANDKESRKCPYLDTVDRKVLDFDLEKVIPLISILICRNVLLLLATRMYMFV